MIITMIMASGPPTRANYDNVQLISTIIQMAYLVVLLLIILILLFIRVKTNSQRFYKWFLIIYPVLMMFLVYRVFTILLIYFGLNNGISPDLLLQYSVIITAASSVVSSVLYLILLVGLRNIDVPGSEQTTIKELSYPQATI